MVDVVAQLRHRSGLPVVGACAFGDSPQTRDELLGFVRAGTKRATVGSVAEIAAADWPEPAAGQYWGVLDGCGVAHYVMRTVQITRGRLSDVTPAFAWDEGEYDRTRESWLAGHRREFRAQGVSDPDDLEVLFERFEIVWPEPDKTLWLADGVRELRWDERDWLIDRYVDRWGTTTTRTRGRVHDVAGLPALVCERDGEQVGVLTFRHEPGGATECVTLDPFVDDGGVVAALTAGAVELGRRNRWQRLWIDVTPSDTDPLGRAQRAYRRAGWVPVAPQNLAADAAHPVESNSRRGSPNDDPIVVQPQAEMAIHSEGAPRSATAARTACDAR